MRTKKLLAAFLFGVGLCFVPALGYGEVKHEKYYLSTPYISFGLLRAEVHYIKANPESFLNVNFFYDLDGSVGAGMFPEGVDTVRKIIALVYDTRGVYNYKTGAALLGEFRKDLVVMFSFVEAAAVASDMDNDIVAKFYTREEIPLGYFYQGQYHLWEE